MGEEWKRKRKRFRKRKKDRPNDVLRVLLAELPLGRYTRKEFSTDGELER